MTGRTITPRDLAERVTAAGHRCDAATASAFLRAWKEAGIVERTLGGWKLTEHGKARYGSAIRAAADDQGTRKISSGRHVPPLVPPYPRETVVRNV